MKKKSRTINMALLLAILLFVGIGGCSDSGSISGIDGNNDGDDDWTVSDGDGDDDTGYPYPSNGGDTSGESEVDIQNPADRDVEELPEIDYEGATEIALSCSGSTITGPGAVEDDSDIVISEAGSYIISGKLCDGQIRVDTEDKDPVVIVFNGIDVTCSDSAPFYVLDAKDVQIMLQEGTDNSLTDGSSYVFESAEEDEPNAALFSKADLVLCGSGSLTVKANYNDGIASKDSLWITDGSYTISAQDDGIRGKDDLTIDGGEFNVVVRGDGMTSDNEEDAEKGFILITDGTFDIVASGDGLVAETGMIISGGTFDITAGGGSSATLSDSESGKGIKGIGSVSITGGSFIIDSADDGVHSDGDIYIGGGAFEISVAEGGGGGGMGGMTSNGQDGIHSDTTIQIDSGAIVVTKSYEGIEATTIIINGGTIDVTATDDGFNCAGGDGSSGWEPGPGQTTSGDYYLYINGGNIWMDAAGDGLDSNGSIEISGGVILVNGPTNDGNGAIDSGDSRDDTISVKGGLLVAAGSSGMAEAPDTISSQNSVIVYLSNAQQGGQIFHIEKSDGTDMLTYAPSKTYESVVFSSPEFTTGQYSVYLGGSSTGTYYKGLYTDGTYTPGTLYTTFTVSSVTTQVGNGGNPRP